jgi:hypothetical protein
MGSNGLMTNGLPLVWKWWNHRFWANRSKVVFDVFDLFSGKDSILASSRMLFCQALLHGTSWQMRLAALVAARMMCFGEAPCTQTQQDHRTGCLGWWWNPQWKLGPSHVFFLLERRFGIGPWEHSIEYRSQILLGLYTTTQLTYPGGPFLYGPDFHLWWLEESVFWVSSTFQHSNWASRLAPFLWHWMAARPIAFF